MMARHRRRPDWDRVVEAVRFLAGVAGEMASLINAIRGIR
jgi:hypothetical protein